MESIPPQPQSSSPPPPPFQGDQAKTDHSSEANNQLQIVTVPPANEQKNENQYDYRFQRSDQWMPVYSWLESLDTDEQVKSNEIIEWLTANPDIREHLSSRHSKYHLKHYIKKCHLKILKKRNKNKGLEITERKFKKKKRKEKPKPKPRVSGIPEDPETRKIRRKEAFEKYNILVEFEKRLLAQMLPISPVNEAQL